MASVRSGHGIMQFAHWCLGDPAMMAPPRALMVMFGGSCHGITQDADVGGILPWNTQDGRRTPPH